MRSLRTAAVLALLMLMPTVPAHADDEAPRFRSADQIPINDLITETQYGSDDDDKVTVAWWLPDEFWEVSLASDPTTTPEGVAEVIDLVSQYTVVIFVDGSIGAFGGVRFVPPAQVRKTVKLITADGETVGPLPEEDVSPDMLMLIGAMRPILQNMLGPMGENMAYIVFPRNDGQGNVVADATAEGTFTMVIADESFTVQTPLSSLLVPKTCHTCDRQYRGDYTYCPYDMATLKSIDGQ